MLHKAKLLLCVCALAHSVDARTPSSPVAVEEGQLRGTCDSRGVCQYLGIPFAAPPIGQLRWRPPQPAQSWQGVRDATRYGSPCVQPKDDDPKVSKRLVGSESCLFLNVWTPPAGRCQRASCPVMFWIHGGAYTTGAGSFYNSSNLVAYAGDVVVVTTNYRLGILGFLGAEALRGRDASGGSTGNYGIQDQRAALQWVRRNIHGFGGDAGNVMIFGESAGGGSVSMHLTMQRSWPLYHKAAIESGAYSYWAAQPMQEAEQQFQDLLNASGCSAHGGLPCLVTLDASKLARTAIWGLPSQARPYGCPFAPTVDGVELQKLPWKLRDEGHFNTQVPVLAGYNKDEGTIGVDTLGSPVSKIYEKVAGMTAGDFARLVTEVQYNVNPADLPAILDVYSVNSSGGDPDYTSWYWAATHFSGDYLFSCPTRRAARAISRHGRSRLFLYYFAHEPRAPAFDFAGVKGINHTAGASHGSEIEFVFFSEDYGGQLIGEDEKLLARTMAAYWVNFARTSDPNTAGEKRPAQRTSLTIPWEPFTPERQVSVRLDLPHLSAAVGRNDPQCDLMDRLGVLVPPVPAVPMMTARGLGRAGLRDLADPESSLLI